MADLTAEVALITDYTSGHSLRRAVQMKREKARVAESRLSEHGEHDQKDHGRRGPGVHNPVHRDLKQRIVKLESMRGGMHPCWKGTLADGTSVHVKASYTTEHRYELAAESLNVFGMEGVDDEFGGAASGLVRMPHAEINRTEIPNRRGGLSSEPVVVTEWVNGKMYGDAKDNPRLIQSEVDDIIVFDFVTANVDRHAGNAMVTLTGHVWSIDHGQTFGDTPNPTMLARTAEMGRVPLSGRQRTWLTQIASAPRERLTEALNSRIGDAPGAQPFHSGYAVAVQQRAQTLLEFGQVPVESDVGMFEYSGFLPPVSEAVDNVREKEYDRPMTRLVDSVGALLREARLMEHPGHADQKVHNPHKISTRAVGEQMLRGKPRVWPPGDPTSMSGLPADHAAKIRAETQRTFGCDDADLDRNLEAVLERGLKNPAAMKGGDWYEEAHDVSSEVGELGGVSAEQGVGMVAALSPQHDWGSNAEAARFVARTLKENGPIPDLSEPVTKTVVTKEPLLNPDGTRAMTKSGRPKFVEIEETRTLEEWTRKELAGKKGVVVPDTLVGTRLSDHDPMVQAAVIKAMSQRGGPLQYSDDITGAKKGVTWSCGLDGISKAVRIHRGEPADSVLNGHKVRSFHNNMLSGRSNPDPDVTIDTHAVSAAAGKRYAAVSPQMQAFTGRPSLASHGSQGLYAQFADSYRRVAKKHNMAPHEAQAIIWLQWRSEAPKKRGG